MPIVRTRIVKPYLLLCEGKDAESFLINYLESEALSTDKRFSNDIQVLNFGGINDLDNYLTSLKNMDNFENVKNLAVIRDAEKNYTKACNEVVNSFVRSINVSPERCGTWIRNDKGINAGYILFPLNNKAGTLEDLCLQILSENKGEDVLSAIDAFLEELEANHGRNYRRKHKNKLHTYLSTSDKYVTMPLGMASKAGAFDWSSICLEPLKEFLLEGLDYKG